MIENGRVREARLISILIDSQKVVFSRLLLDLRRSVREVNISCSLVMVVLRHFSNV